MRVVMYVILVATLLVSCEWLEETPAPIDIAFSDYSDYYNGDGVAINVDITNLTGMAITRTIIDLTVTFKYNDGSTRLKPEVSTPILAGETLTDVWIPLVYGHVWYDSHQYHSVYVEFSDGSSLEAPYYGTEWAH